jgi:predicted ABC-type transport system involved in lysophospholipase L1 biosynthesis ATPase subunit
VQALQGLDLVIAEGALIGEAGSSKSALVDISAGLDTATAGTAWVADHNLVAMTAPGPVRHPQLETSLSFAGGAPAGASRHLAQLVG